MASSAARADRAAGTPADLVADRETIREELARILASPLFRHSRHYTGFLRYVVEHTLDGQTAQLKERTLGVKVFGREADYDSTLDPVVRTSASEVRKRLAQYYSEPGRERGIRILLYSGSYVPEFRYPESPFEPVAAVTPEPSPRPRARRWLLYAAAAVLSVAVVALVAVALYPQRTAAQRFWGPVWTSSPSVMICVGGGAAPAQPAVSLSIAGPTVAEVNRGERIAFGDALTLARLTAFLGQNAKAFDVRRPDTLTLADLRKGPTVLIGAFNNPWTLRLDSQLRFTFERDEAARVGFIRDRLKPGSRAWQRSPDLPYSGYTEDYGIVSRISDPRTEEKIVVVAGMGKDATIAAGEFVTGSRYLEALAARAPAGWERMNVQVVIAADVVNGNTGPPRILDTHFW